MIFLFFFSDQIKKFSLSPLYSNILEYENFINRFIFKFLLGGISALDELPFDSGKQKDILSEQLLNNFKGVYRSVDYGGLWNTLLKQYLYH